MRRYCVRPDSPRLVRFDAPLLRRSLGGTARQRASLRSCDQRLLLSALLVGPSGGMQFRNLARKHFARRLFFAQRPGDFSQAQVQLFDRAVAITQVRVEFAFAKREDVGAQLEALFVEFGDAGAVALFEQCATLAFFERLHPEGFGDVGDAFGQAVQGGGAGVESGGQGFPPGIQHRVDGVGRAAAEFAADFFDSGALA